VLKMIEWRWGLKALTPRDKNAHNLASVLDFGSAPDLTSPTYSVPPFVPTGCGAEGSAAEAAEWGELRDLGHRLGWGVTT
jgi:phospholipase C